jgi:hypothetical protein
VARRAASGHPPNSVRMEIRQTTYGRVTRGRLRSPQEIGLDGLSHVGREEREASCYESSENEWFTYD